MKSLLAVSLLLAASCGCAHLDYIGETYAPSPHVDLYFAEKDVPRDYRVMGQIVATAGDLVSAEKLQAKIEERARQKGADAVVLLGLERYKSGENTQYHETTRQKDRKSVTTGGSSTTSEEKKEIRAIFVKYK